MTPADRASSPIEIVPFSELESRRELWTELAYRSGNVFATWEWAELWWRHFGEGAEPAFAECRHVDGRPFAILPLYVAKRGTLRVLRLLGHGPADVLGPICDPADGRLAGLALRQALGEFPGRPHLLLAERLSGGPIAEAFGGRVLRWEANPRIDIDGASWEEYMATRSRNLREKLRRGTRKLERAHELRYRLCGEPSRLGDDFSTLLRLHRDRWGNGGDFMRERVVAFHRELTARLLEDGRLRLWMMELDGTPVAAWYGFRFAGTESFYQSGRARQFDKLSVGFLMLAKTIEAAFDDGLDRYAFLRGNEAYKHRFATADDGLEARALGRGPLGEALVWASAASLRSARMQRLAALVMR